METYVENDHAHDGFLNIPSESGEMIKIPIGKMKPNQDKRFNQFELIKFTQQDGELSQGYLYIFKNKKLWRECEVTPDKSYLKEVDLEKYHGCDHRPASGLPLVGLTVPIKVNNKKNNFSVIYSTCQWSWARVNYRHPPVRFIPINYPITKINNIFYDIKKVELELANHWQQLFNLLHQIKQKPFFHAAVYAYHLFYGDAAKSWEVELTEPIIGPYIYGPVKNSYEIKKYKTGNSIYKAAQYLNKKNIINLLEINNGNRIKNKIITTQHNLIKLLDNNFNQHLLDILSGPCDIYGNGFGILSNILLLTSTDPNLIDASLNLTNKKNITPGVKYLEKLFNPNHPLHSAIFNKNFNNKKNNKLKSNIIYLNQNTGSGEFRSKLFKESFENIINNKNYIWAEQRKYQRETQSQKLEITRITIPNIIKVAVGNLIACFKRHAEQMDNDNSLLYASNIIQATGVFHDFYLGEGLSETDYIPGLTAVFLREDADILNPTPSSGIPIFSNLNNTKLGYASNQWNYGAKINKTKKTKKILIPLLKTKKLLKFKLDKKIMAQVGRNFLEDQSEGDLAARFVTFGLRRTNQTVTPILLLMASINLIHVLKNLDNPDQNIAEKTIDTAASLEAIIAASLDTANAFLNNKVVSKFLENNKITNFIINREFTVWHLLGSPLYISSTVLSSIGLMTSCYDAIKAHYMGEKTLSFADGVIASGQMLSLLSSMGKAIARNIEKKELEASEISELDDFFMCFGPWGWGAAVLVTIGYLITYFLQPTPLENWALHGPFSNNPKAKFAGKYKLWAEKNNQHLACLDLLSITQSPWIKKIVKINNNTAMIQIVLQQFFPGRDGLQCQAELILSDTVLEPNLIDPFMPIEINSKATSTIKPIKIIQLNQQNNPRIIAMEYFYNFDKNKLKNSFFEREVYYLDGKTRLYISAENSFIPAKIFPHDQGWHHANNPAAL